MKTRLALLSFVVLGSLLCAEALARTQRTVLDPSGHVDVGLVVLTLATLLFRVAALFGAPAVVALGVTSMRRAHPHCTRPDLVGFGEAGHGQAREKAIPPAP